MAHNLDTANVIQPMTTAVTAALEATRTTLAGIEKFLPIEKETDLDRTFRFNLWIADFEDQVTADFPNATDEKKASLLLRHLDHKYVREFRAETLDTVGANIYAKTLTTIKSVICLPDIEKEAKREFYALQPLPNEPPDSLLKRLTLAAAPCNFGETKDQEIMKQALSKVANERWQIRADTENWSQDSLTAGKAYAKKMVALKTRIQNLKETYGRGNAVNAIQQNHQSPNDQQQQPQPQPSQVCLYCNYRHSPEGPCFAARLQCYGCGEYGHLIARCTNPRPPQLQQQYHNPQTTRPPRNNFQFRPHNPNFQARNLGYGQPQGQRPQQQGYGYPRNPQGSGFRPPGPSGYHPTGLPGYRPSGYRPSGYRPSGYRPSGYRPPGNYGFQQRFRYQNFGGPNRGQPGRVNAIDSDPNFESNCECQHDYTGFESGYDLGLDQASGYDPSLEQPTGLDPYQETDPSYGYEPQQEYPQPQQQHQENHQQTSHQQEQQQEKEQPLDSFYSGVKRITLVEDDL